MGETCLRDAHAIEEPRVWTTADNNITCALLDTELRCDVAKHSWPLWACRDNGCFGSSFVIPSKGKARMIRASDTTWTPNAALIRDGQQVSIQGITCHAQAQHLTCQNTSGGRMVLSRTSYTLNR